VITIITRLFLSATISAGQAGAPSVSLNNLPQTITNALAFFAGGLSVIFLLVGGLKYVTSAGDPKRTNSAKQTITYAIIGLIVAIMAFAIANFVLGSLSTGTPSPGA